MRLFGQNAIVEHYKYMIVGEEENTLKFTEELDPLKSRLRQIKLPNEELDIAKKEVGITAM